MFAGHEGARPRLTCDRRWRGGNNGFSNMHQLMTDLHEGTRKSLPCGAGLGMLAVDHKGGLNLCHRFTGSNLPTFGNVRRRHRKPRLGAFLGKRWTAASTRAPAAASATCAPVAATTSATRAMATRCTRSRTTAN